MTVDLVHTYTDPPQRISTELSGGGAAQDLFPRVQVLLDHLPEPGPARTNTDGEREQLALLHTDQSPLSARSSIQ